MPSGITYRVDRQNSPGVRPWNGPKFVQITSEPAFQPPSGVHGAELIELMGRSQEEFSRRFKGSPVKRATRRGLLRTVAVALGNWGAAEAVPVLVQALDDGEPLIRGHEAWAQGRIGTGRGGKSVADQASRGRQTPWRGRRSPARLEGS